MLSEYRVSSLEGEMVREDGLEPLLWNDRLRAPGKLRGSSGGEPNGLGSLANARLPRVHTPGAEVMV
jgi:hypothetical protein